ncbi:amidohydrolase family protein [Ekhidna sp. To15]|uniref:amidohydrolase family protein n=1 Tax=Ekhidna sp. To15 TaxID=3395267 RepID=UPI003F51C49A
MILITLSIPLGAFDFGKNPLKLEKNKFAFINVSIISLDTSPADFVIDSTLLNDVSRYITEKRTVLVNDGKIISVIYPETKIDEDFEVIDGEGKFLMAGLMDMHTHLFDRSDLLLYLANGVTTVRNMMGMTMHLRWKEQVNNGDYPGPTIYTASPTLNSGKNAGPFHKVVKTPEQAKKAVRKYAEKGYDFIKIYDGITYEILTAIAAEAKQVGLPIAGHPSYELGIDTLVASGMVSLEHAEEILQALLNYTYNENRSREIAEKIRDNNIYFTPTLAVYKRIVDATLKREGIFDEDSLYFINPLMRTIGKKQLKDWVELENNSNVLLKYDILQWIVRDFREEGVPMLLGTDTGPNLTIPGFTLHEEIALMIESGLTAYEVLYSGTVASARALGMENSKGAVSEGMDADLVLLDENPLLNVSTLKKPVGVMKDGVWYDKSSLKILLKKAENHTGAFRTFGRLLGQMIGK